MTRFVVGMVAALMTCSAGPVRAQGVFDLGAMTNALSSSVNDQAGKQAGSPASAPPAPVVQSMTFRPSMAVRKQNIASFIANLRTLNPDAAAQMEKGLAQTDLIEEADKAIAPYGLHVSNVADTYALYVLNAWMAAHGRTDDNTAAQAAGVQKLAQAAMAASPVLLKLDDAGKQKLAENLVIQATMFDMMIHGTASNPAAQAKVQAQVRDAAKGMGFDPGLYDLTADGLVRKR